MVLLGDLPQHGTEQRGDLGRHQDSGLQSVVWLFCRELSGGWERGGPGVPVSPRWFGGASATGSQGKGEQEVCSLPALAEWSFTTWRRDVCRLVLVLATPATERALPGLLAAITPGKEGLYSSWLLNVIAFIDFGNQFYGL